MAQSATDNVNDRVNVAENGTSGNAGGVGGNIEIVTPADAVAKPSTGFDVNGTGPVNTSVDTGERRKRGRPPGSGSVNKKAQRPVDINGVEKLLLSLHTMAAAALSTPELMLDEAEAKQIATATKEVADQYDVTIDPKLLAWFHFSIAIGTVYGTRIVAIGIRKKREKNAVKKPHSAPGSTQSGNVILGFPDPSETQTVQ